MNSFIRFLAILATISLPLSKATAGECNPAAQDCTKCETKIKNAAAFKFAQELAVPVQNTKILELNLFSSRAAFDNSISGSVTVRIVDWDDSRVTDKTFKVSAQEVGFENDCDVLSVE